MIHVRLLRPEDRISALLQDQPLDPKDTVFVAELNGDMVGVMVERVVPLVHTLEIKVGHPLARKVADALIQYGAGYTKHAGFDEAVFMVRRENYKMEAFMSDQRVAKDINVDVYTMGVE